MRKVTSYIFQMVEIKIFNKLPLSKKLQLIYSCGTLVSARVKGKILIYLYTLTNFFVEVHHRYSISKKPVIMVVTTNSELILRQYKKKNLKPPLSPEE